MQKKESELKRDYRITLRFTEDEYEGIKVDAADAKMRVAEYGREMLLKGQVIVVYKVTADMNDVRTMGKELHAIGNNLNQIAQYFHTGGARSECIIQEINSGVKDLERIRKKVEKLAGESYGSD